MTARGPGQSQGQGQDQRQGQNQRRGQAQALQDTAGATHRDMRSLRCAAGPRDYVARPGGVKPVDRPNNQWFKLWGYTEGQ